MKYSETMLYQAVSPHMEESINKILNKDRKNLTTEDKVAMMRHLKFMDQSGLKDKTKDRIIDKLSSS